MKQAARRIETTDEDFGTFPLKALTTHELLNAYCSHRAAVHLALGDDPVRGELPPEQVFLTRSAIGEASGVP